LKNGGEREISSRNQTSYYKNKATIVKGRSKAKGGDDVWPKGWQFRKKKKEVTTALTAISGKNEGTGLTKKQNMACI